MSKNHKIIPIFVPHLGCPNDCVFCNQRKITNVSTNVTQAEAETIIKTHLETLDHNNTVIEISFFGGTFTGIPMNQQRSLLEVAYKYKKQGLVDYIRMSTRPDYISEEILNLLEEYSVDIVELGVQSLDEKVLIASNRGHNTKVVTNAVNLLRKFNIKVGIQIMPGLCESDFKSDLSTVNQVIKLSPDFVRIYPTLIIKNTALEEFYLNKTYNPLTLKEAVFFCKIAYAIFYSNNIQVIRMGLQATDGINWDGDIVDGPFHPAFRSLVLSELYGDMIYEYCRDKSILNLNFEISSQIISYIVGQNKSNVYRLNKLGIKKIKFKTIELDSKLVKMCWNDSKNNVYTEVIDLNEYCKKIVAKYKNPERVS